ncbi:MAG: tetratricopeptide (TPR) repeat protein/transcriptional regulator with XRE-family HTH domain [Pseudohongiellaceae bacterium]|jgi:tetratricopeptide (TPR) repeat protein/transcriptional regulator with XRE-family HTH domain
MSSGKHPHLAKKLSQLYISCINPSVSSNAALAKHLGISRQAISKWIHGSETSVGNNIPHSQILEVAAAFGMEPYWFGLELDEFGERLGQKLEPRVNIPRLEKISLSSLPNTGLNLFGRSAEIEAIDRAWYEQDTNCLEIVAFGGVGKSSLVNSWLSRLDKLNYAGANRVYAWSFYWQGTGSDVISSGDLFIEQALEWFGDKNPEKGTPWAKANRLADLVRESRTLLILDGLEPLQYPPGPKQGEIENPAVSLLLRELAANNNGLCIITSRLSVSEFESFSDGRIRSLHLERLSNEEGVQFLSAMGIYGDENELRSAVEVYSGHPLCLSLLAGYLGVVHDSNVSHFKDLNSLLDIQSFGAHASIIVQAYLRWFDTSLEISLLNLLGLFDRGIPLGDVQALVASETVTGLTEELRDLSQTQWSYAIRKLVDANLISASKRDGSTMIDCHPLIRDFLNEHLRREKPDVWRQGNKMVFNFLQRSAIEDPQSMVQLEPLFRAVIHGTRAGLFEESFQLYFERIKRKQFSIFTEGSHHADQSCIRAFFRRPWTEPIAEISESASFYLLSCAAANLIYLGKIDAAIEPSILSIQGFQKSESWFEAAATSAPLVSMLIAAGRLDDARQKWSTIQESVGMVDNEVVQAVSTSIGAYLSFLEGDLGEAARLFDEAEKTLNKPKPDCELACATISSYYCKFLLDTGETERALERALLTLEWRRTNAWQVAVDTSSLYATDLLLLGLSYLKLADLKNASHYLNKQVELFRAANEWLYLPSGLIGRAKLHMANSDYISAEQDLVEALSIARDTGARFSEWEAEIAFAELALKSGNTQLAESSYKHAIEIEGMESYRCHSAQLESLKIQLYSGQGKGPTSQA